MTLWAFLWTLRRDRYTGAIVLHFASGRPKVAEVVKSDRIVLDKPGANTETERHVTSTVN